MSKGNINFGGKKKIRESRQSIFVVKQKGRITSCGDKINSYEEIIEELKKRKYAFIFGEKS